MNYIRHLNKAFDIMFDDDRLSSGHIMLYITLFHRWNMNRFKEYFYINRTDIMHASRIKSLTTYTRCFRELEACGYLAYYPSFNSLTGTKVCIYPLCDGIDTDTSKNKPAKSVQPNVQQKLQPGVDQSIQPDVQLLYINNNKEVKTEERQSTPTHQVVLSFFKKKNWEAKEANKFFFHYEMNGWTAGNNNPIRDWQAAAQKWMLNTSMYNNHATGNKSNQQPRAGNLHATTEKNYSEPL